MALLVGACAFEGVLGEGVLPDERPPEPRIVGDIDQTWIYVDLMGGPALTAELETFFATNFAGNYGVPDPPVVGFSIGYRGAAEWDGSWFITSPLHRVSMYAYAHDLDRDEDQTGLADVLIGLDGSITGLETARSVETTDAGHLERWDWTFDQGDVTLHFDVRDCLIQPSDPAEGIHQVYVTPPEYGDEFLAFRRIKCPILVAIEGAGDGQQTGVVDHTRSEPVLEFDFPDTSEAALLNDPTLEIMEAWRLQGSIAIGPN